MRAYSDDIAAVAPDWGDLPRLARVFRDYELVSGLTLHLRKTAQVQLFDGDPGRLAAFLEESGPAWAAMQTTEKAKYLGVLGRARGREPRVGRPVPQGPWGVMF